MRCDLAIIGSGFAGLAALKQALEAGLNVCLVTRDSEATRHFSGVFDIIDPRWGEPQLGPFNFPSLRLALDRFILGHPAHPYARLAENMTDFSEALVAQARNFFKFYGIPVRADEKMIVSFGSAGDVKPTGFTLFTQGIRVDELSGVKEILVVGMRRLREYALDQIAQRLRSYFKTVRTVVFDGFDAPYTSPLAGYLFWMQDKNNLNKFKEFIEQNKGSAQLVLIPPVLASHSYLEDHRLLEEEVGVRVVEMLSVLPSSSGLRFQRHIGNFLSEKGIAVHRGNVLDFRSQNGRIESIMLSKTDGDLTLSADNYILAGGKYIGGGIQKASRFKEAVFDLPLFVKNEPLSAETRISKLLTLNVLQPQPFLEVGVLVNDRGRPVDHQSHQPVYENLKACGHVLAGFDFTRERCGFGVSLATALQCFL